MNEWIFKSLDHVIIVRPLMIDIAYNEVVEIEQNLSCDDNLTSHSGAYLSQIFNIQNP